MRIVGGQHRGRTLVGPSGRDIRPTSDRLREALFNILGHRYGLPHDDTRVLDLFAGTGALALEALSRGAVSALMIDNSASARGIIRQNIEALELTGVARLFRRDATRIGAIGTMAPFDLVFCDPPYGKGLGESALSMALEGGWMAPDALVVLEERASIAVEPLVGLDLLERRSTGDTQHVFLRRSA